MLFPLWNQEQVPIPVEMKNEVKSEKVEHNKQSRGENTISTIDFGQIVSMVQVLVEELKKNAEKLFALERKMSLFEAEFKNLEIKSQHFMERLQGICKKF